jgi:MFS family permease
MVPLAVATVVVAHAPDAAATVRLPRDDALVRERDDGAGRFVADEGPFTRYERVVADLPGGGVEERTTFSVAGKPWGLVFVPGFRAALRHRPRRAPWWAPPERLDHRAATVLALLCSLTLVSGYLGTVMSQTATFAADEFGSSTSAQSGALATTRIGVVVAIVLTTLADRRGRRRMVAVAAAAGCVTTAVGAVVPSLGALTASQVVARGFASGLLLLIAIVSAEEMPAGSRAYAYSLLTLTGGLGAGMCLWALPIADVGERSWRLIYALPLLFLPVVRSVMRHLPETKRFAAPHVEAPLAGHGRRFWLLALTGALLAVFAAPASQLLNEFLRDQRGFSAVKVALFTMVTVTPAGLGVVMGGRLADVRGRRVVAAVGILGGTVFTIFQFGVAGWAMWVWGVTSSVLAGAVAPSYGVYRSELFPTSLRGRLGGVVELINVSGSAIGLVLVGALVDGGRTYAESFAWIAAAPLAVAVVILLAFPETAHRSLEDINPEDQAAVSRGASP